MQLVNMVHRHSMRHAALVLLAAAVLALAALPAPAHGNELDDMLYDDVPQEPCVRLINAFGSVGCSSA